MPRARKFAAPWTCRARRPDTGSIARIDEPGVSRKRGRDVDEATVARHPPECSEVRSMTRIAAVVAALAMVVAFCATADAAGGKKKKKKAGDTGSLVGTITAVSDNGKSITVT